MGKGMFPSSKPVEAGGAYLVVVALNAEDDIPDLKTMRAFLATSAQGVSYEQGVWRWSEDCTSASADE